MRWLTILLLLGSLICMGRVLHAQTSLGDANATSSLIFPQAFLKEQVDPQPEDDSSEADSTGNDGQIRLTGDGETQESSADSESSETTKPSGNQGTINFNTADGSIKGNYFFQKEGSPWRYGFELQGKAINGYASLFASQDISSDAGGHLFVIYSPVVVPAESEPPSSIYWWALARIGYRHGEYKLVTLESNATVPEGLRDETLQGPSAFFHGNALWREKFLFGAAIGWAHQSNYGELPQVEVTTVNPAPLDSTMTTITERTSTAREGGYETFGTVNGDIDLLWIPERSKHTVGLGGFGRSTFRFNRQPRLGFGGGLFYLGDLTEKTDPPKEEPKENFFSKITGGITVQYKWDLETGRDDLKFGLVTSYNF